VTRRRSGCLWWGRRRRAPSTDSASMAMRWSSRCGAAVSWRRPGSKSPRGRTVTGHNRAWLDRLLIRPAGWARPTPAPGRQLTAEGNPMGASCTTSHAAVPTPSLTAILPDRLHHTHSCTNGLEAASVLVGAAQEHCPLTAIAISSSLC
jgi:hypothetical protein